MFIPSPQFGPPSTITLGRATNDHKSSIAFAFPLLRGQSHPTPMLLRFPTPATSLHLPKISATQTPLLATTRTTTTFSISDAALTSRGFTLHTTPTSLNLDHLNTVFVAVGFPKRDPAKIRTALDHTDALLWIEHAKSGEPVAFARATGDGVFNAIIWDVVVDPSFQGIGLGKAVMERLVAELVGRGIVNIALYAEPRVVGFYRPLGFAADPGGIRGMVYSRKQQKSR